jgi:hypothetical protein
VLTPDHEHVSAQLGAGRLDHGRICAGDRHAGTLGEELAGRFEADTDGAVRDERALIFESFMISFFQV